jgi:hypothetical protein
MDHYTGSNPAEENLEFLPDLQEPRNLFEQREGGSIQDRRTTTLRRRWKCRISLSLPTVTTLKWQGAYYKNIGAADDPSVTGIQNPEPAWLRGKLPVNKCSQNLVSLYVTLP